MYEFVNDVQANTVPLNYTPSKEFYIYNIREVDAGYVFDVVLAPLGTPVSSLERQAKFQRLGRLKTLHNGLLFDTDPTSRTNILVAISGLAEGAAVEWKLACNTWVQCTPEDLKEVLATSQRQIQEIVGG